MIGPLPKISVITVSFNSSRTISKTIESVLKQNYKNIEYIIIDGGSDDGTVDIIKSYGGQITKFISEPDNGIYDAINKGIKLASGDIVGLLNSDDVLYNNNVIQTIADAFSGNDIDAVYGDVLYVNPENSEKVVRYYSSANFTSKKFKYGYMPAHPGFYVKKELFEKIGYYKTDYRIAADYELLIRFLYIHKIRTKYLDMPLVRMMKGGVSTRNVFSNITLNKEIVRACRENGIKTNYLFVYSKYLRKIFELTGPGNRNGK